MKLSVRGRSRDGAKLLRSWTPSWKTEIIRRYLAGGGLFVDVGTNIGQTLIDFVCVGAPNSRYVGFEPNPHCVDMVQRMIDDNRLPNAEIIGAGLSDENGVMKLFFNAADASDQGGTIVQVLRPDERLRAVWVTCLRFDDVVGHVGLDDIGLIKVDVEGAELHTIGGMSQTMRERKTPVLCEVLHRDPSADAAQYAGRIAAVADLVHALGYRIHRVDRSPDQKWLLGFTPMDGFPDVVWGDASDYQCDYLFLPEGVQPRSA